MREKPQEGGATEDGGEGTDGDFEWRGGPTAEGVAGGEQSAAEQEGTRQDPAHIRADDDVVRLEIAMDELPRVRDGKAARDFAQQFCLCAFTTTVYSFKCNENWICHFI